MKYIFLFTLLMACLSLAAEPNFYPYTNMAEHFTSISCPTCQDALAGINVLHDQLHNGELVSARHYIQSGALSYPGVDNRFAYYDILSTPVMVFNGQVKVIGGGDSVIDGSAYLNALKASRYWGSPLRIDISGLNVVTGDLSGAVHNLSPDLDLSGADIVYMLIEDDISAGVSRVIRAFASEPFAISGQGTIANFDHSFVINPAWNTANLWAAVFVQTESQRILQTAATLPKPDLHIRAAFDWDPVIVLPVGFHYESESVYFFNLGQTQTFMIQMVVESAPPNWFINYCDETGGCFPGSIPRPLTLPSGQSIPLYLNILVGDSGVAHFYWLVTAPGMQDYKVHFTISTDDVSIPGDAPVAPTALISAIYPNPFSADTRIRFELPKGDRVKLEIFNVKGQRIALLTDAYHSVGSHEIVWNGRDAAGRIMPAGVYFSRLSSSDNQSVRKLILLDR